MGKSIIPLTGISDRQWSQIMRIAALLQQQYSSRQATLLKRLDVTVQSFKWSDKAKQRGDGGLPTGWYVLAVICPTDLGSLTECDRCSGSHPVWLRTR
ncbi:unnamed protein product [Schistosoma curassoni]|uniref:Transposase n=1 Tax=Schistosoma curassoni TaxID=6186 RepID=A0A183KWH0_9TREM|nr:unnamed protein product [Schistosoma curassoni]